MTFEGRRVVQPGPANPARVDSFSGPMRHMEFPLETKVSLLDAIVRPLEAYGIQSAGVTVTGVLLSPMHYVMPAYSGSPDHAAYYSDTREVAGPLEIEHANVTVGRRDGRPFIHCHAMWRDSEGRLHGGHILPHETMVLSSGRAVAFGSEQIGMVAQFDPETNFTLFQPTKDPAPESVETDQGIVARIRPNEDLIETIEAICRQHHVEEAIIRSGVGSLVGAEFVDGRRIEEIPTEILVIEGQVSTSPGSHPAADMTIALIDTQGDIHVGKPARSRNPVLICFELVIEAKSARGE